MAARSIIKMGEKNGTSDSTTLMVASGVSRMKVRKRMGRGSGGGSRVAGRQPHE